MKNRFFVELLSVGYWFHIVIIVLITLGLLELFFGNGMFSIVNILLSIPLIAFADVVAHWITGLR